ncbi:TolC family outer membrane protein [Aromatoleum petrolei]|uniref:TolC family outer membrane protein n=1 Tax=Aromatoleum petrolei TaxID=76116 RepID=A0ABX1MWC5_9RHOO|nr:TolC family outer membrane protein [Aromatoleum petrolei]NMF90626.1 TolC family outer membrane protein [Aromatoleum petrolei]QTQ35912.1 Type I secretion outer membrane protein, TolC family [Aromatoleum petrolei]
MKRAIALSLVTLFSASAWSADLLQVYRDALTNDARFAAARAQYEAGQERVVQGRAGLLPAIGANANTTWNDVDTHTRTFGTREYNSNGYGVQLTQPLFRWQNWIQYKQGELQTALAEVQLGQARHDLILRVSQAYFDVLNAQDALAAQSQLKKAASEQLELAKASFEVGTVTITDVHEAQSRFDLASAQEIAAQNDLDVRRQALVQIVGQDPSPLAGLRQGVSLSRPQPDSIAEWATAAEQGSYAVQAQQIAREIAEREVERNRAGHYPTLDVVAARSHNSAGFSSSAAGGSTRTDANSVGLQLNVPIFAGGAVSSREREAAALKIKADADLDDARRSSVLAARQAYLGVTSGMAQVKALEAAQVSSTSALEANRLGYEVGVRINIDVLNAQSQLADTQRQLARARYDTILAQLRLKAAAGTLGEEDVQLIDALLMK